MIHVLDASRSVTVVGALLSDRKADYVEVRGRGARPRQMKVEMSEMSEMMFSFSVVPLLCLCL